MDLSCSQQPADPTGQRGDSPPGWVLGDAHHVSPRSRKGPGLGVLHPPAGGPRRPRRTEGGMSVGPSPLLEPARSRLPQQAGPGCGDGWTVCPVLPAPEQPALPAFPGGAWAVAPGSSPLTRAPAWTRARIPIIPLAVTGVLRVGAGQEHPQLGPLPPLGPGAWPLSAPDMGGSGVGSLLFLLNFPKWGWGLGPRALQESALGEPGPCRRGLRGGCTQRCPWEAPGLGTAVPRGHQEGRGP